MKFVVVSNEGVSSDPVDPEEAARLLGIDRILKRLDKLEQKIAERDEVNAREVRR